MYLLASEGSVLLKNMESSCVFPLLRITKLSEEGSNVSCIICFPLRGYAILFLFILPVVCGRIVVIICMNPIIGLYVFLFSLFQRVFEERTCFEVESPICLKYSPMFM